MYGKINQPHVSIILLGFGHIREPLRTSDGHSDNTKSVNVQLSHGPKTLPIRGQDPHGGVAH